MGGDFNWGGAEQSEGNAVFNSQAANGQWKANDATNQTGCPKFSGVKPHGLTAAKVLPGSATLTQAKITHPSYYSAVTVTQSVKPGAPAAPGGNKQVSARSTTER